MVQYTVLYILPFMLEFKMLFIIVLQMIFFRLIKYLITIHVSDLTFVIIIFCLGLAQ